MEIVLLLVISLLFWKNDFDNGIPDETEDSNEIALEVGKNFHSNLGEVDPVMETPSNGVDIYQNNKYVGSHGCSNRTV